MRPALLDCHHVPLKINTNLAYKIDLTYHTYLKPVLPNGSIVISFYRSQFRSNNQRK